MWEQKFYQDCMDKQRDVCSCRQVEDYYELIGWLFSEHPHQKYVAIGCYDQSPRRVRFLADIHITTPVHR